MRQPMLFGSFMLAAIVACGGSEEARQTSVAPPPVPAPPAPSADRAVPPPAVAPPPRGKPCRLDPARPGPMRRGGRASIRLDGDGMAIDAQEVPAICGALHNADVSALKVRAGQGLLFEACLPEGTVQINADDRKSGKQTLRSRSAPRGASALFNAASGVSYVARGKPEASDQITVAADLWKAEAEIVLRKVVGTSEVKAKLTFDCSEP